MQLSGWRKARHTVHTAAKSGKHHMGTGLLINLQPCKKFSARAVSWKENGKSSAASAASTMARQWASASGSGKRPKTKAGQNAGRPRVPGIGNNKGIRRLVQGLQAQGFGLDGG